MKWWWFRWRPFRSLYNTWYAYFQASFLHQSYSKSPFSCYKLMVNQQSPRLSNNYNKPRCSSSFRSLDFGPSWHHCARFYPCRRQVELRGLLCRKKGSNKRIFGTHLVGAQCFLTIAGRLLSAMWINKYGIRRAIIRLLVARRVPFGQALTEWMWPYSKCLGWSNVMTVVHMLTMGKLRKKNSAVI